MESFQEKQPDVTNLNKPSLAIQDLQNDVIKQAKMPRGLRQEAVKNKAAQQDPVC